MGFDSTTLRDVVGCSNHWAGGDSVVRKGQWFVGLDWNLEHNPNPKAKLEFQCIETGQLLIYHDG